MTKYRKVTATLPKPFVKWVGGKGQLLNQIVPRVPKEFGTYYEPFLGGGAVYFQIRPDKAIISDSNRDLIRTYHFIRDNYQQLFLIEKEFEKIYGDLLTEENFNILRDIYNQKVISKLRYPFLSQKAFLFIYLNKTCFNGLYRVNKKGEFNVGFNNNFYSTILDDQNLKYCKYVLNHAQVWYRDFREVLQCPEDGDFVFLDPPYMPISATSNFVDYTVDGFTYKDLLELKNICDQFEEKGVKFLLCNSDCQLVHELFEHYNIAIVEARRSVNSNGAKRGKINEVIITNYGFGEDYGV